MIRDLIDEIREEVVLDPELAPTREVIYTQVSTSTSVTLNSFVGAGQFNKEEKDSLENIQSFGGLKLDFIPKVNDTVEYDGQKYAVQRYTKLGTLYTVYCEQKRQSRRR